MSTQQKKTVGNDLITRLSEMKKKLEDSSIARTVTGLLIDEEKEIKLNISAVIYLTNVLIETGFLKLV